jgi:predicted neuraminidase
VTLAKLAICCVVCTMAANGQTVEFIADRPPTASSHGSTIVELSGGDLLAAWFGGTHEAAPDVAIWSARRDSRGWSAAKELVREPEVATFNPVLFEAAPHLLWLYYKFGPSPGFWSAGRLLSRDEGKTWSSAEHLPAGLYGPIRTKPLVLNDGLIVSGSSVESYGTWACWIERSTDHGAHWTRIGPIAAPAKLASTPPKPGAAYGIIQPSLIHLGDGHIRLYARSTPQIGRICQADSFDNGLTWGEVTTTALPNPNSGIDAVRLEGGAVVMIYNRSTNERSPLDLAISGDGTHWHDFYQLEEAAGEYSYPAMVEARNGDLLITYTWRRQKIRFVRFPRNRILTSGLSK